VSVVFCAIVVLRFESEMECSGHSHNVHSTYTVFFAETVFYTHTAQKRHIRYVTRPTGNFSDINLVPLRH
jgi:hypothetical protein